MKIRLSESQLRTLFKESLDEISADMAGRAIKGAEWKRRDIQQTSMAKNTVDKINAENSFSANGFLFKLNGCRFDGTYKFYVDAIKVDENGDTKYGNMFFEKDGRLFFVKDGQSIIRSEIGYAVDNLKAGQRVKLKKLLDAANSLNNPKQINENKAVLNEDSLRKVIRNFLKEAVLNEWDWDDWDEDPGDFVDTPEVSSKATFYFNPQTLEIEEKNGSNEQAFITLYSNDFPKASSYYEPGDYYNPPYSEDNAGPCGGDFEIYDGYVPDEFEEREEEIYNAFVDAHGQEILDELSENAEFV